MRPWWEGPYSPMRIDCPPASTHGMLVFHRCSPAGRRGRMKRWMASSRASASREEAQGGVTISSRASEKSVVIAGWVSAAPSASGWFSREIAPFGRTRSDSFSRPMRRPAKTSAAPSAFSPMADVRATRRATSEYTDGRPA